MSGFVRRTPNSLRGSKRDVHVTCEGKVLQRSEELKSGGVGVRSTVKVTSGMSGGGRHRDKKTE